MNFLDEFLELIFPTVCGFCGKINKEGLCKECEQKISMKVDYCIDTFNDKYFEKHIYAMKYDGIIRNEILNYKFHDKSYMYKTFSKIILKSKKICDILENYDIITDVSIHKKRKKERGYDQSALIAKEIARNIGGLKYEKLLKKVKNTPRQSSLKKSERLTNIRNAYEVTNKAIICGKRIVIFDDIYTTGATANECAKVLKQMKAKEILILTLAK